MTTTMGTIRSALQSRSFEEGDRVIFVATTDKSFDLRPATEVDEKLSGLARVLNQLGIDNEYPGEDRLASLATALFLSPDAPRRKVVRALRERKLDDLADAVANE